MISANSKLGHVYQCSGCESITVQRLGKVEETDSDGAKNLRYRLGTGPPVGERCGFCGRPFHVGGPFWMAPMHDADFVKDLIASLEEDRFGTYQRLLGMLSVASKNIVVVLYCSSTVGQGLGWG